jgi:hypothetical protein
MNPSRTLHSWSAVALVLVAACGSSSSAGVASVDGGANGDGGATDSGPFSTTATVTTTGMLTATAFHAKDISAQNEAGPAVGQQEIRLQVTDYVGVCEIIDSSTDKKANCNLIEMKVQGVGAAAVAPGTYTLASNGPSAQVKVYDSACNDTKTDVTSGTIVITAVTAFAVTGSFHLSLGANTIDGTFDAPFCSHAQTGTNACIP